MRGIRNKSASLIFFLMFGNLIRECGVLDTLSETAQKVLANLVTILLGITIASQMQAEKFLFQVDAMETMKSISDSSTGLLNSMSSIAATLGSLTIDKAAMMETQRNFVKT